MSRPVIGIITNFDYDANYFSAGYNRITINNDYPRSVQAAGGVPLLIAPSPDLGALPEQLGLLDGLILAGGNDVDPRLYGQDMDARCQVTSPVRDAFELEALRVAQEQALPVFGICRGLQVLNTYLGGTLFQDLSLHGTTQKHAMTANLSSSAHGITVEPGSFLAQAWGAKTAQVNSFHHQVVDQLAEGLKPVAWAADGVIEAVESTTDFDVTAVQWHPEMMSGVDDSMAALFRWFVTKVAR